VAVRLSGSAGKFWHWSDKLPNATGALPTAMVALTVLYVVSITETLFDPTFAT
jgi:hypothetical protein